MAVASHLMDIASFAPQLAFMIGLGVGVDYALLIVTRYLMASAANGGEVAAAN